ncbi:MAG TPA: hypothetical protein VMF09_13010 [Solirubrobacteraceae bacterium]|nr:hypothetical protein [Solirubrobacteraceae bacterium]
MSAAPDTQGAARAPARPRVAILIVNGFARAGRWARPDLATALAYPWIELCLRQIERHSRGWDYQVFVFDNSQLARHRAIMREYPRVSVTPGALLAAAGRAARHVPQQRVSRILEYLLERKHPLALDHLARKVPADFQYIVTLDTDSFPVRDDWLEVLVGECERGAAVAGVYRNEMAAALHPFVHVSGLCVRRQDLRELGVSFGRDMKQDDPYNMDVGQKITYELLARGRTIAPLHRSNEVNYHFIIGGIYGDIIYHQAAGSRRVNFWTSTDNDSDEHIGTTLRDAAFRDLDQLIAILRGQAPGDLALSPWKEPRPGPSEALQPSPTGAAEPSPSPAPEPSPSPAPERSPSQAHGGGR